VLETGARRSEDRIADLQQKFDAQATELANLKLAQDTLLRDANLKHAAEVRLAQCATA